jgi:hypothetical protein
MFDNQLIKIFYPIIKQGFVDFGLGSVIVRQAYQPTQQGTESDPAVHFFKISDKRYGSPYKYSFHNFLENQQHQIYRQLYETTFQISALSAQNPKDMNSLTASDLVNITSEILQLDSTIKELKSNNVGILRISDIRNPIFVDDRDQFEESPSFDFTLRHFQDRDSIIDFVTEIDGNIYNIC